MAKKRKKAAVGRERVSSGQRLQARQLSLAPNVAIEGAGIALLLGLAAFFIATSWRKWPDPLIDFGRELYLPWRMSEGAVFLRDVGAGFGPLAQHFNAALFFCFGPGLMVLVTANLILFAAILTVLYLLFRQAWGVIGAITASAVFISVFGFSQLVGTSNYNYATPYAHETTHGLLVSLTLLWVLTKWFADPRLLWSALAGGLFGLTFVLKAEFILAAGVCGIAALVLRCMFRGLPPVRSMAAGAVAALTPSLAFVAYFAMKVPLDAALLATSNAWLRFVTARVGVGSGIQATFIGLNDPSTNVPEHVVATLLACAVVGAIVGAAVYLKRAASIWVAAAGGTAVCAAVFWLSAYVVSWIEVGRCLLGLMLIYGTWRFIKVLRRQEAEIEQIRLITRCLLPLFGALLMLRMAMNGRIYHYGFYQAAIAGCVAAAVLVAEVPEWVGAKLQERWIVTGAALALLLPCVFGISRHSQAALAAKTTAVAEGSDLFYVLPRRIEATGEIVKVVSRTIKQHVQNQTLLVLPEGVMINYLSRLRSPLPDLVFLGTNDGLVARLEAQPPDFVLVVSRDLREYGIARYGAQPGSGGELVGWISEHYKQVTQLGGDPLDPEQRGAVLYERTALR